MNDDILSKWPGRPHEKVTVVKGQEGSEGRTTEKQQKSERGEPGGGGGLAQERNGRVGQREKNSTLIREGGGEEHMESCSHGEGFFTLREMRSHWF